MKERRGDLYREVFLGHTSGTQDSVSLSTALLKVHESEIVLGYEKKKTQTPEGLLAKKEIP